MGYDSTDQHKANQEEYTKNLSDKTSVLGRLGLIRQNDPISKLQSYEVIKIETEKLLNREKILFTINSIVTVGLIITVFRVI